MSAKEREAQKTTTISTSGVKMPGPNIERQKEEELKTTVSTSGEKAPLPKPPILTPAEQVRVEEVKRNLRLGIIEPKTLPIDVRPPSVSQVSSTMTAQDIKEFNQYVKSVSSSPLVTSITDAGGKAQVDINTFLNSWAALSDSLYERGNLPTDNEKASWLLEVQNNPYLAYDVVTGSSGMKPPTSLDEAIARVGYMASEIGLGGAREVVLPFSLSSGQPRKGEDAIFQVIGALITPSPADYLFQQGVSALIGTGKKGSRILRKVLKGTALNSDEARQFEKLVGQYGYSTNDIRKAGTKLGKLSQAEWDDFIVKYGKWYDYEKKFPNLRSAGAGYKPSLLQEFGEILEDIDIDAGEYIDFLKANKLGPTLNSATIMAFIQGVKPPTPDLDAYQDVLSDVEKFRESLDEKFDEATEPVLKGPIEDTILKDKEKIDPEFTPPIEETEEDEDISTLPGHTEKEDEDIKQVPPDVIPVVIPDVIEEEDQPTPVIQDENDDPVPIVTDTTDSGGPDEPESPKKPRRGKGGGMPPNIFRALVGGKSEGYRVKFDYPKGKSEIFTVKARSFPQALSQAQGLRRVRHVPSEVDIAKKGVTG